MSIRFELLAVDGAARRGRLSTPHGVVETPMFMPVGTQGAVKAVTHRDLTDAGARIILGNTYHLHLRPGEDLIARRGGSIAFVEVKARADLEVAAIAISATKRRRIARAARVWLEAQ